MTPALTLEYSEEGSVAKGYMHAVAVEVFSVIGFDLLLFVGILAVVLLLRGLLHHFKGERRGHGEASIANKAKTEEVEVSSDEKVTGESSNDLAQVVANTISTRLQASKVLAFYKEFRAQKKHFSMIEELTSAGSKFTALEFYTALVQCAGRSGHSECVVQFLRDMVDAGIERPMPLYESAMRLLASRKFFKEAIEVYELVETDCLEPTPVMLSCLVGFAAELGDVDRANAFFKKLCSNGGPSLKASMMMLGLYAKQADWASSLALFKQLRAASMEVDSVLLNIVLATGVASGELEAVKELLVEEHSVADVVSHNTLLKGLAQQGDLDGVLELLRQMRGSNVGPSVVSFNTAIDAAVRGSRTCEAWRLFEVMQKEHGLMPDKCTCSTLVKGLSAKTTTTAQILKILDLVDVVFDDCSSQLRRNLLCGTLDASTRCSQIDLAMRAFAKMRSHQIHASVKEYSALLTLLANAGDTTNCTAVWASAAHCSELGGIWAQVKYLMDCGYSIDLATLELAPQFSRGPLSGCGAFYSSQLWAPCSAQGWHIQDCW